MRALVSVANRHGLLGLAHHLQAQNVSLFATSTTLHYLQAEGIKAEPIHAISPAIKRLQSGIEALHPTILNGLLSRDRANQQIETYTDTRLIDVVVINLDPFASAIAHPEIDSLEGLEKVDIAGIALIRAAASNFRDVIILVRPEDYAPVMQEWQEQGEVSLETRRHLAAIAFQYIASYDTAVAASLRNTQNDLFPQQITLSLEHQQTLRYGENPHQHAALYRWSACHTHNKQPTIANAELLNGKELSYNNLLDLDTALHTLQSFTAPTVAIIKHTNPCGLACDDQLVEAYKKAHGGDPISAAGGTIGCNRTLDAETAQQISQLFYEAIIAPEFSPEALTILRTQNALRLLATHTPIGPGHRNTQTLHKECPEVRSISGGLLLQTPDAITERDLEYHVVSEREPTFEEVTDLLFAWKAVQHVKSNAIVLAKKLTIVGVGAGQMNRVTSVQLAVTKAAERAKGAVLASDASFPFADGIEAAARAGITAIIQPGGSLRDEECIRSANRYAIAMIFTGRRHFRH